ncbi:MAG TPA: 30S ribosomal protein S18 [Candidatus Limnocylindria bacterium]|nr:30S ribosomal protein S18 [Candidatus Limnocylindria bacterium]
MSQERSGPRRDGARSGGGSRDRGGDDRGGGGDRPRYGGARRPRRKVCAFCVDKVQKIDFKEVGRIRRYISDRGKIDPRRKSGTCAKHQRMLTAALKRARHMALLPYTAEHVRSLMSPQARAMAGGPPPPKPDRPPFRPGGYGAPAGFRPAGPPQPPPQSIVAPAPQPAVSQNRPGEGGVRPTEAAGPPKAE